MDIIGSYVSPYVRKVLAALELKGLAYRIDPITPFFGNDAFGRMSPLRRIPVLVDDGFAISDSTVIADYLDEAYPHVPLLPAAPQDRARARWIEEYAGSKLADILIWGLFYQKFVRVAVWGEAPDEARIAAAQGEQLPQALDYLETIAPGHGFAFDAIGRADIAVAAMFRNAALVGVTIDASRWPRTAGWVARTLAHPALQRLAAYEDIQIATDIPRRRQALLDAGAPLTETTLAERTPRRGMMTL